MFSFLYFYRLPGGWVGGWSEDWRVMLNSTQDQVEVEVRVELGNMKQICDKNVLELWTPKNTKFP